MKKTFIQTIKFFLCTQAAWWLDLSVFSLMFEVLKLDELLSKSISYTCGAIISYTLNRRFTFKNSNKLYLTLPKFIVINLLAMSASLGSIAVMSKVLHLDEWLAYFLSIVFSFSVNYFGNRFWVFCEKRNKKGGANNAH